MKKREQKTNYLFQKLLFSCIILFVYLVGRSIPLYGVELTENTGHILDAENLLKQTIGGDSLQRSVFALGIVPYMIASLSVQMIVSFFKTENKSKISQKKVNRIIMELTLLCAVIQSVSGLDNYRMREGMTMNPLVAFLLVLELVGGAILIIWLSDQNKRYGIGGQTLLILVNIIDGLTTTIVSQKIRDLHTPLLISLVVMFVVVVMENTEVRLSLQRISIHSIYADNNYLAIKLNPIGIMPVMFSTAFFMLPQLVLRGIQYFHPSLVWIDEALEKLSLTDNVGILVYLVILYILTLGFSLVMLNPTDIADNLLKSGDSLIGVHAGKDTKRFLTREILKVAFISATVMGICIGYSLYSQKDAETGMQLTMLPASIMMITGLWCTLFQEMKSIHTLDKYKPFI